MDFTQNKQEVAQAVAGLYFPDFSEANFFDALLETMTQMRDVKGKKAILVIATGFDTFSKHTLDQTLKSVKETDVTIFCVGWARRSISTDAAATSEISAGEEPDERVRGR